MGIASAAQAQECNILAPGSDAGFDQIGFCAPVTGRVKYFTFYSITEVPASSLKVEINWGEGKKRYNVESLGYDPNLKMYTYQMPEATHVYEENRTNPKCSYPVTVQVVVNNKVCGSPKQSGTVIVWDKDNENGGNLALTPDTYYACPGSEFSVSFEDESTWNCVPPKEKTNVNWPKRTTQFVYGTVNTISGIVKIDDAPVASFPMEGVLQEYKDKDAGPSGAFSRAAKVTIPATAKVGERFEITLNNWNYCNPMPEAPIQRKALIEIVAKPEAAFIIKNQAGDEAEAFCPGEPVKLYGDYYTVSGEIPASAIRYDWTIEDLKTGDVQKFEDKKDLVFEKGFAKPGEQKITLKVSNKNVSGPACESILEKTIALVDAPAVTSFINNIPTNTLYLCADDMEGNYKATFEHLMQSNEVFTYTYNFYKRNSTKTSPDSTLNVKLGSGVKNIENKDGLELTYTTPGSYRLEIVAKNNSTGCVTVEENKVVIYERPIPNFTVSGSCVNQSIRVTDKSKVSNNVPGDKLTTWIWDMDYTEENERQNTFDRDKSGKSSFNWTYKVPGTYRIALKVTSQAGCESIKIQSVEIKDAPIAVLKSNYTNELICPGDTVRFFNESLGLNTLERFPLGVSYKLFVTDSITTKELPFSIDKPYIDYSAFYNPNDSVETYSVWLEAKDNDASGCVVSSAPINIKVRSGAAAGYTTTPLYSPFEPNCTPKSIRFVTDEATQALKADRYKWSIVLNGEIKDEIIKEKGKGADFETLEYTFGNKIDKHLDYEVVLSVEKAGLCIAPAVNTFRIYPNPKPVFTAQPVLQACDSVVFELKVTHPAGISDYTWAFGPERPSNDNETGIKDDNFYIAYARPAYGEAPVEYTVHLSAKNFYGCEGEWTEKITVDPVVMHEPVLELISTVDNECRPYKATFINNTIGESSKIEYVLYIEKVETGARFQVDPEAIEGNIKDEFSYTFQESGNFKVYLEGSVAQENSACMRPLSKPVAINVKKDPNANFTVFPAEDCGTLTTVIAKTGWDSEYNTWIIKDAHSGEVLYNSGKVLAAVDPFHEYTFENTTAETKQYTIQLTAENSTGCAASDSMVVTVHPKPKAHFNVVADACDPYAISVEHQTEDNPSSVTYTWIWGDGTISEGTNPPAHFYRNASYTNELHYNLKLVAKSANGCIADSTIRVIVHPRVKADFEVITLSGCAPLNVSLMNKSKGADEEQSGWYMREKEGHGFSFVDHSLLQYTFENNSSDAKTYEVMYVARNRGGCADSVVKEIVVQPAVIADFSATPQNTYSGQEVTFTNNAFIPGVRYTWNWGDGSALVVSDRPTISHEYTNTTAYNHYYEVTLTAEDPVFGCKSTKRLVVTVYPAMQMAVSPKKDTVCVPEIPEFNIKTQNVSDHYWYVGKKGKVDYSRKVFNIYDPILFDNTSNSPIAYEVVYVGITAEGNKDSVRTEVVVYPALNPSFTLDAKTKELPHAIFAITNTTPFSSAWNTSWDFGNGETSNKINPGTYEYKIYGYYTITMTVSNGFCSQSYAMNVSVSDAQPDVSFEMEHIEGCWPLKVTFKNTSKFADNAQYLWDFGDGIGTSTAINPSYTYNKPGNYKVTLQATNRTGEKRGSTVSEQVVKVYAQPSPDFVVRKETVYIPDEPVYVANYSMRGVWYRWDFGDGTIYEGADQFEPVHYYKKAGVYNIKLVVRSEYGCEDSVTVMRAVTAEGGGDVIIPNAFTPSASGPNGGHIDQGGINDVFHPVFKGKVDRYHLLIYNRWGDLIFETKDTAVGWDGYHKGQLSPSGVYLYKLSAILREGKTVKKVGDLTLIR